MPESLSELPILSATWGYGGFWPELQRLEIKRLTILVYHRKFETRMGEQGRLGANLQAQAASRSPSVPAPAISASILRSRARRSSSTAMHLSTSRGIQVNPVLNDSLPAAGSRRRIPHGAKRARKRSSASNSSSNHAMSSSRADRAVGTGLRSMNCASTYWCTNASIVRRGC
jgi:hypothetical protein